MHFFVSLIIFEMRLVYYFCYIVLYDESFFHQHEHPFLNMILSCLFSFSTCIPIFLIYLRTVFGFPFQLWILSSFLSPLWRLLCLIICHHISVCIHWYNYFQSFQASFCLWMDSYILMWLLGFYHDACIWRFLDHFCDIRDVVQVFLLLIQYSDWELIQIWCDIFCHLKISIEVSLNFIRLLRVVITPTVTSESNGR